MNRLSGFDEEIVLDVATTGFDSNADRIVSVVFIKENFASLRQNPK